MTVRMRIALCAVVLVAMALLVTQPVSDAHAQESAWRTTRLARIEDSYSFAWAPDGAAWTNPVEDSDGPSTIVTLSEPKGSTTVLAANPLEEWDDALTWYQGRYYWVRASAQGWLGRSFAILSAEPGGGAPTTIIKRRATYEGRFELVAGRMMWSEWLSGKHEWAVYSMRLGGTPRLVARFRGSLEDDFSSADVCLSSRLLAWAELISGDDERGKTTVHVVPLDPRGRLGSEIVLSAEGSYTPFTLAGDVDRLAWAAENGSRKRVLTWRLGDAGAREVPGSAQPITPKKTPFIRLGMSRACIAWTSEMEGPHKPLETTVKVWLPKASKSTTLATYKYGPLSTTVGAPVVSKTRVAWVVDTGDDPYLSDGSVVTWKMGEQRPQPVASGVAIAGYDSNLAVDGDRVSYALTADDEYELYVASMASSTVVPGADQTEAIAATSATLPAPADAVQGGIRTRDLMLAGLTGGGLLVALGLVFVWRRRRNRTPNAGDRLV